MLKNWEAKYQRIHAVKNHSKGTSRSVMQVRVKYLCSYIFATKDKKVRYLRYVFCEEKTYQRVSCGESFSAIVLGIARLLDDH
jgi:hypothetical protein